MAFVSFVIALLLASQCLCTSTIVFTSTTATGPSNPVFTSSAEGLDSAHLSRINSSSFQWWYFDAVASNANASIVLIFFSTSAIAFPFVEAGDVTTFQALINYPDGSIDGININANSAIITTSGQGSSGHWEGAGSTWEGTPDLSSYTVSIDSPGISGTFSLNSIAPGHYPCGPAEDYQTMLSVPGLGWANAVPDAVATVDFTLHGNRVKFTGSGYHDQNWGAEPLISLSSGWYWGHGRVGEYSIVWSSVRDISGIEHPSAYVSKNGVILTASCAPEALVVRPIGSPYPPPAPNVNEVLPTGFSVVIDLGTDGVMTLDVNAVNFITELAPYADRWTGIINGTVEKGSTLEKLSGGNALFEQFILS